MSFSDEKRNREYELQFLSLLKRTGMAEVKEIINPISINSNRSFLAPLFHNFEFFFFFHHSLFLSFSLSLSLNSELQDLSTILSTVRRTRLRPARPDSPNGQQSDFCLSFECFFDIREKTAKRQTLLLLCFSFILNYFSLFFSYTKKSLM